MSVHFTCPFFERGLGHLFLHNSSKTNITETEEDEFPKNSKRKQIVKMIEEIKEEIISQMNQLLK